MAEKFWDEERELERIDKGGGSFYVARIVEKDGNRYGEVRQWFEDREGNERPTKKGLVVPEGSLKDMRALWDTIIEEIFEEG